jgi:copper resistance protein C
VSKSRQAIRFGLALILALAVSGWFIGSASAHAKLVSATPSDGETLHDEPATVTLIFSEDASVSQSYAQVFYTGAAGSNVRADNGDGKIDPNNRTKMTVTLKPGLSGGDFTVKWHTVTEDDNGIVDGSFSFHITTMGEPTGPTGKTGTMTEATPAGNGSNTTGSPMPVTGNGWGGFVLLAAMLGLLILAGGLLLRRTTRR